jgi:hypothetical protein
MTSSVQNSCWSCRHEISAPDQLCPHCGATVNLTTRGGEIAGDSRIEAFTTGFDAFSEPVNEPIADHISKLAALHQEGSLTAKEFQDLKETVIRRSRTSLGAITPSRSVSPVPPKVAHSNISSMILPALIVGLIWLDHTRGPLFPDDWYCAIGAGTAMRESGYTRADSWSANNGCGPSIPGCATGWSHVPARSYCLHSTVWDAIRNSRLFVNGFGTK